MWPFWQDCGPASAGNTPGISPRGGGGTTRFCTFPCSASSRTVKPPALTCQPGDVSAAINQRRSGPCGSPLWPLRALPPTAIRHFQHVQTCLYNKLAVGSSHVTRRSTEVPECSIVFLISLTSRPDTEGFTCRFPELRYRRRPLAGSPIEGPYAL